MKKPDTRKTAAGTEYMVSWRDTWLRRSESGKAPELLRVYESKGRTQHERNGGRPAHTDENW